MRTRFWAGPLALLLVVPTAWAFQDAKDQPKTGTPAEQFQALTKELDTTLAELRKQFREAKSEEEKQKIRQQGQEPLQKITERAIELAEKHPKDPVAIEALAWVLTRVGSLQAMNRVLAALEKDHLENSRVGLICEQLVGTSQPAVEKFFKTAMAKSKNKDVQGLATHSLAAYLQNQADEADNPGNAGRLNKDAEKLFEQVLTKYADVKGSEGPIGKSAKAALSLVVGHEVQNIEGEDIDGKSMKLSDYRGKVVLLDFWGHW